MQPIDETTAYILAYSIASVPFFLLFFARNSFDFLFISSLTFAHYALLCAFIVITQYEITDSSNYFYWAEDADKWGLRGTGLVVSLVGVLRSVGINDYILLSLFFSTLSLFGILALLRAVKHLYNRAGRRNPPLALCALFFLPGLHFWTAPIGKDSLSVFLLGIGLYPFLAYGKIFAARTLICLTILFLIRPHLGAPIIIGLLIYLYLTKIHTTSKRVVVATSPVVFVALSVILFFVYIYALEFVQKYSPSGFLSLMEFVKAREDVYQDTSSGFDLSSVPIVARPLLFMFGVLPWQLTSPRHLVTFIEGSIVFLCTIYGLFYLKRQISAGTVIGGRGAFFFITGLVLFVIFSMIVGNAGLAARMRTIPVFFLLYGLCTLYIDHAQRIRVMPRSTRVGPS